MIFFIKWILGLTEFNYHGLCYVVKINNKESKFKNISEASTFFYKEFFRMANQANILSKDESEMRVIKYLINNIPKKDQYFNDLYQEFIDPSTGLVFGTIKFYVKDVYD